MTMHPRIWFIAVTFGLLSACGMGQTGSAAGNETKFDWAAFHRNNDAYWAKTTQLSPKEIRKLRLAADVQDDEPSNPIDLIDAKKLSREQILFVTAAGSGHCLTLNVFVPYRTGYRKLWSESETPDGGGFCHPSLCQSPQAWASKKGEITVMVPEQLPDAPMGICDRRDTLIYRWTGKTYALAEQKTLAAQCGFKDYFEALRRGFARLAGPGETLASVEIVPAFRPESVIFFQQIDGHIKVAHVVLKEKLWSKVGFLSHRITPSECVAEGESAEAAERKEIAITSDEAEKFLSDLSGINLLSDECPRRPDGSCAVILDPTEYVVILQDGSTATLRALPAKGNLISENPALLDWVNRLLQTVKEKLPNSPAGN